MLHLSVAYLDQVVIMWSSYLLFEEIYRETEKEKQYLNDKTAEITYDVT